MKLCSKSKRYYLTISTETKHPSNISVSLLMAFAAEAHRTEGQFRHLKSTFKKLKSLKFRFDTHRPTVSKRVGQYFQPLKTSLKKGQLGNASEHLW